MTEPHVPTHSGVNDAGVKALKLAQWAAAHRKFLVFALTAVVVMGTKVWGTDNSYIQLGLLVLGGLGVHQVPNTRK